MKVQEKLRIGAESTAKVAMWRVADDGNICTAKGRISGQEVSTDKRPLKNKDDAWGASVHADAAGSLAPAAQPQHRAVCGSRWSEHHSGGCGSTRTTPCGNICLQASSSAAAPSSDAASMSASSNVSCVCPRRPTAARCQRESDKAGYDGR